MVWLFALTLFLGGSDALAGPRSAPAEVKAEVGLDARLSTYAYPHEVHVLALRLQQQDLELAYMDVSPKEPNGQTVVLLHGKNFSGAYWEPTVQVLVDAGYRVVVPDQIGFGKSSKPEHFQYSFHALAQSTRSLLDHLEVEQVSVVGHSMGGMLATRFALLYPERVGGLVLLNPIGLEDWQEKVPYQPIDHWYAAELKKTPEGIRAYMKASYFDGVWKPAYDPLVEILAGWTQGPDHERIAWTSALTYDMIFTQPVVHDFPRLAVPTLLVVGERDRTALGKGLVAPDVAATMGDYPALGRAAGAAIPRCELLLLPGIGHIPQFEASEPTHAALLGFLAASSGG